ncbi:kinase-like domain-containing protein [Fusarium flagelliforme]|uniref:kinase-like domain-containing protein n=1 Tax=Fusarium flagelliforme TaxID=2675880 RepID=UPI001E8D0B55|nr:kinase-like domain-containing protein [Fusarium flagelliforme]KAH7179933.1 kinase-like domain-containing protein [Fusarium flagelliforme]
MIRSWLPKLLYRQPWPLSTAVAPKIDRSILTEEETTPLYHPDRFYPITLGQVLDERYQVATKLGYGGNSTVWLCRDFNPEEYVAIKVNALHYPGANRRNKGEEDVMQHILRANTQHHGYSYVRKLLDSFTLEGPYGTHECLPILQMTLTGLDYLHSECRVVHGDMKPGNLMMTIEDAKTLEQSAKDEFVNPVPAKQLNSRTIYKSRKISGTLGRPGFIQISDFDSSSRTEPDKVNMGPVGAEIFRAPEIMLNAGYTYPADIWSLGTMIFYLLENKDLFDPDTHGAEEYDEQSHLGKITALIGPPPLHLLSEGERTSKFYKPDSELKDPGCIPHDFSFESSITCMEGEEKGRFIRFIKRMLKWDPDERATASELLEDPWLNQNDSGD